MVEIKDIAYQRQQGVANAASSGNGHDILTKLVEATDDAHKNSMTPDEVVSYNLPPRGPRSISVVDGEYVDLTLRGKWCVISFFFVSRCLC